MISLCAFLSIILLVYLLNTIYRNTLVEKYNYLYNIGLINHYSNISLKVGIYNPFSSFFYANFIKNFYNKVNYVTGISGWEFTNSKYVRYRDANRVNIITFIRDFNFIYNEVKSNEVFYYLLFMYDYKSHKLLHQVLFENTTYIDTSYYISTLEKLEGIIKDDTDRLLLEQCLNSINVPKFLENGKLASRENLNLCTVDQAKESLLKKDIFCDDILKQYLKKD